MLARNCCGLASEFFKQLVVMKPKTFVEKCRDAAYKHDLYGVRRQERVRANLLIGSFLAMFGGMR